MSCVHQQRGALGRYVALSGIRTLKGPAGGSFPLLFVDREGHVYAQLAEWYRVSACPPRTRTTYLQMVLPFAGFLQRNSLAWNDPPDRVREHLMTFLKADLGCAVAPAGRQRALGYAVEVTSATPLSESSLRVVFAALRDFYTVMQDSGLYPYANPMQSQLRQDWLRERARTIANAGAPDIAGIRGVSWEESRAPGAPGANGESGDAAGTAFFRLRKATPWTPALPREPAAARARLHAAVLAMIRHAATRRERALLQLLLHSGARLSEVLSLTAGGLRAGGFLPGRDVWKALVRNKGSRGKEIKLIYFTDRVYRALLAYIRTERAHADPEGRRRLDQLADHDPLFLTRRGGPYTALAFRYHWRPLAQRVAASFHLSHTPRPHDLRHLMVTENMAQIRAETPDGSEARYARTAAFARLMGWRGRDTLTAYDHSFAESDALEGVARWQHMLTAGPVDPLHARATATGTRLASLPDDVGSVDGDHTLVVEDRAEVAEESAPTRRYDFWEDTP